mmetsp:Transcript_107615/g.273192  ORF Transcript_107615/g.273192 Transcript_107615/m.273192 type:complete len:215 (+) Transcript_107615:1118-1762(+)
MQVPNIDANQASSSCCALSRFNCSFRSAATTMTSVSVTPSWVFGPAATSPSVSTFASRFANMTCEPALLIASTKLSCHSLYGKSFLEVKKCNVCRTTPSVTSTLKPGPCAKWWTLAVVSTRHSFAPNFMTSLSALFFFFMFAASSASTRETSCESSNFWAAALNHGTTRCNGCASSPMSARTMKPRCTPAFARWRFGTRDFPSANWSSCIRCSW